MSELRLHRILDRSVERWPDRTAVEDAVGRQLTYRELGDLRRQMAQSLKRASVSPGDRVGLCLPKSLAAVAAVYGILECGAGYVPLDPEAPAQRNAYILADCGAAAVWVDPRLRPGLAEALDEIGHCLAILELDPEAEALPDDPAGFAEVREASKSAKPSVDDLAYILYTSGSTGQPKGVVLSHRNADSFLTWCRDTFEPQVDDRFSSHAPLHFDLSILDLHLPLRCGACVVLIDESTAKDPRRLAPYIATKKLTRWYSAPSTLAFLAQFGQLPRHDLSSLRQILFAGEVFPIKHLRSLMQQIPQARYFNLYGPTETNVCTFYELPTTLSDERTQLFPIGATCGHLESHLASDDGRPIEGPGRGELWIRGPAVTRGYWNLPSADAQAFVVGKDVRSDAGGAWYRTGDWVERDSEGLLHFLGRRDRMVKRRGYRIELDEIEACLYRHPRIEEAAVVAHSSDSTVRIEAVVSCLGDGAQQDSTAPSVLELRQFVHRTLPNYMVPDRFRFADRLPRTSTGKVDYVCLSSPTASSDKATS